MAEKGRTSSIARQISILVVTESPTLREALGSIVKKTNSLRITGEALNGSEALDMLKRITPDVVLLDLEIPPMDDMTVLHNIMIHQPTPTIILPSLSKMGLKQSFPALKNGAVDFVCIESIYKNQGSSPFQKEVVDKVTCASKMDVTSFASKASPKTEPVPSMERQKTNIVFCEECGARNIFDICQQAEEGTRCCAQCGDLLETHLINLHKRTHYITVIAAGKGSYTNLLKIIPRIPMGMSGAVIIMVYDVGMNVDTFVEYIDTISRIQILRLKNGMSIDGGNCYVAAATENFCMKPYSTRNTMVKAKEIPGYGPVDLLMKSVSEVFKKNTAGLVLSGVEQDADKGLNSIKSNNGISAVLFSANCLHRQMGENALRRCQVDKIVDENDATKFISERHDSARDSVSTT
jgi:two-component system chemotaxis response regulator CheB